MNYLFNLLLLMTFWSYANEPCSQGLECASSIYRKAKSLPYPKNIEGFKQAYQMANHGCSGIMLAIDNLQKPIYDKEGEVFLNKLIESLPKENNQKHDLNNCRFINHVGVKVPIFLKKIEELRTNEVNKLSPEEIHARIEPLLGVNNRYSRNMTVYYAYGDLFHAIVNIPDARVNDDTRLIQYKLTSSEATLNAVKNREKYQKYSKISNEKMQKLLKNNHAPTVEYLYNNAYHPSKVNRNREEKALYGKKGVELKIPSILKKEGERLAHLYLSTNNEQTRVEARAVLLEAQKSGQDVSKMLGALDQPTQYKKQHYVSAKDLDQMSKNFSAREANIKKRENLVTGGKIKTQADVDFVCRTKGLSSKKGMYNKKEEYYCEQAKLQLVEVQRPKPSGPSAPGYKTTVGGHSKQLRDAYKRTENTSNENNRRSMERIKEAERRRYDKATGRR